MTELAARRPRCFGHKILVRAAEQPCRASRMFQCVSRPNKKKPAPAKSQDFAVQALRPLEPKPVHRILAAWRQCVLRERCRDGCVEGGPAHLIEHGLCVDLCELLAPKGDGLGRVDGAALVGVHVVEHCAGQLAELSA
eukprot:6174686-Pleurochrysis_carterae.AAC.2